MDAQRELVKIAQRNTANRNSRQNPTLTWTIRNQRITGDDPIDPGDGGNKRGEKVSAETGSSPAIFRSNNSYVQSDVLYPNPTNGIIYLDKIGLTEKEIYNIRIRNVKGNIIETFYNVNTQLNIINYASGVYFLEISSIESNKVFKIIKM